MHTGSNLVSLVEGARGTWANVDTDRHVEFLHQLPVGLHDRIVGLNTDVCRQDFSQYCESSLSVEFLYILHRVGKPFRRGSERERRQKALRHLLRPGGDMLGPGAEHAIDVVSLHCSYRFRHHGFIRLWRPNRILAGRILQAIRQWRQDRLSAGPEIIRRAYCNRRGPIVSYRLRMHMHVDDGGPLLRRSSGRKACYQEPDHDKPARAVGECREARVEMRSGHCTAILLRLAPPSPEIEAQELLPTVGIAGSERSHFREPDLSEALPRRGVRPRTAVKRGRLAVSLGCLRRLVALLRQSPVFLSQPS